MVSRSAYKGDFGPEDWSHPSGPNDTWGVSDFKSIGYAHADCREGSITVLTGANSIGKSSFLQSLLMVCQGINYGNGILLNGPLVSLGYPADVIRHGQQACRFSISFSAMKHMSSDSHPHVSVPVRAEITLKPSHSREGVGGKEALLIDRIEFTSNGSAIFTLEQPNYSSKDYLVCMETFNDHVEDGEDEFEPLVMKVVPGGSSALSRTFIVFKGLEPVSMIRFRSEREAYRAYRSELLDFLNGRPYSSESHLFLLRIADEFRKRGVDLGFWRDATEPARREFAKLSAQEKRDFVDRIARGFSKRAPMLYRDIAHRLLPDQSLGDLVTKLLTSEQLSSFDCLFLLLISYGMVLQRFAERVEYIGPLRDDPRVVSPLSEVVSKNLPVGLKGELAASLLLMKQGTSGTYGLPENHSLETRGFEAVLDSWARYLGVADSIRATNLPKYGVGFSVASSGLVDGDLTMVGVGASQITPILIGVLCAASGSIVLIEQPELHLHPSAQSKLADFFLFARPDLTLIIESHSEALITRLRRRVVEEPDLSNKISIVFLEKRGFGQGVVSRKLAIDEYGNLDEWPSGFMDAVQEDTRAIMKAAIARRKAGDDGNAK